MSFPVILVFLFLALNLAFAVVKKQQIQASDYLIANRSLKGFSLFASLLASNLSAFTVFGVSGAGYRIGWTFFPVMAFGTGFMAISFILYGIPLRRLSKEHGWLTPSHCIRDRFQSKLLALLYALFLLIFTVPYLSVQIGSGGKILSSISGLPAWLTSLMLTAVITLYVLRGGMRSVVRSDILQAFSLYGIGIFSIVIIFDYLKKNGITLHSSLQESINIASLFTREGRDNAIPLSCLLSYYLLWFLADPMFPHLTQRFYAAKSDRALFVSMALYPFASLVIFFIMTAVGVAGAVLIPGLSPGETDQIFTKLTVLVGGDWAPVFIIAALAALMSTMDSQLLTSAGILVEDFIPNKKDSVSFIKLITLLFALLSWLVSLKPPQSILTFLTGTAFLGYAVLAPIMFFAIYAPQTGKLTAATSLITGAILVFLEALKLFTPPIPAVFFNVFIQLAVLMAGLLHPAKGIEAIRNPYLRLLHKSIFSSFCVLTVTFYVFSASWGNCLSLNN